MMKAIYVRVSTADQLKGYSIGNQIEKCVEKAGTLDVLQYVEEGRTGEIIDRPQLNQLREDVRNGVVNEIICYDPTRLSRNLLVQLMIKEELTTHDVKLTFCTAEYTDNAEGELQFNISGTISQYEKAKIKERTVGGKVRKMKEGKVLGAYGLYGYDYDQSKQTYVINEKQAEIVRMIFDYFTDPSSPFRGINGIAKHLTELGIPTARNKTVWHRQVVRQILINEAYTGNYPQHKHDGEGDYVRVQSGQKRSQKLRPKEEWIYTKIPSIISVEQWEMAQDLIKTTKRRFAKESLNKYLLSGLVRCSDCGNTMTGRVSSWWGEKRPMYSDAKNYSGAKHKGCGNYVHRDKLDGIVWEHVLEILNEPEKALNRKNDNKNKYKVKELESVSEELEKIKKSRKRLISLAAMSDDTDLMEIKVQLSELKEKESSLQVKYNQLEKELKEVRADRTEAKRKAALDMYFIVKEKEVPFEIKQKIIREIVEEIYVSKVNDEVEIHIQ
jgi:site-specific DNA recombinase